MLSNASQDYIEMLIENRKSGFWF